MVQEQDYRPEDEKLTMAAGEFGKALYMKAGLYGNMHYVGDILLQKLGIDIILDTPMGPIYIDEKMAIKQRDKNLMTYSLELSSNNNRDKDGNPIGWFTSPNSLTTHYAFTWFRADSAINTITSWETAVVSKDVIKDMLHGDGIEIDGLKDKFLEYVDMFRQGKDLPENVHIRERTDENNMPTSYEWRIGDYKVVQSLHLKEKPINIVVPKDKLMMAADFIIDKSGTFIPKDKLMKLSDLALDENGQFIHRDTGKRAPDFFMDSSGSIVSKQQLTELKDAIINRQGYLRTELEIMYAVASHTPKNIINVQHEIEQIHNAARPPFPVMSQNQIKQVEKEDRVPGELSLSSARYVRRTGKMRSSQDGDFLYIGTDPRNTNNRVATYSKELNQWLVSHPDFPVKGNPKFIDAVEYVQTTLLQGQLPVLVETTNNLHEPIDKERFQQKPEHGDVAYLPDAIVGGQRISLTYNKFIDSYTLSHNNIVSAKDMPTFMGRPVLPERTMQLEKAIGERIIHGLRRTLHDVGMKYKDASAEDLKRILPQVLKEVQSNSWTANRYSDVEAVLQTATEQEKNKLFHILNNPRLVTDLAQAIATMPREDKYLPECLSAVIYKPSRQREYERLDRESAAQQKTSPPQQPKVSKPKTIRLEEFAQENVPNIQTFTQRTRMGDSKTLVSWSPGAIEKTAAAIQSQLQSNEPLTLSGRAPAWASIAIMAQMDTPVNMRYHNEILPVQTVESAQTSWRVERDLPTSHITSQGLDFKIQRGQDAIAVEVMPSLRDRQDSFTAENMEKLRMPAVKNPPENVYLKVRATDGREVPTAVIASIAKTYMDIGCNVYVYNGHIKAFSCVNKNNLHVEPKKDTDFAYDMYLGNNLPRRDRKFEYSHDMTPSVPKTQPKTEDRTRELALSR